MASAARIRMVPFAGPAPTFLPAQVFATLFIFVHWAYNEINNKLFDPKQLRPCTPTNSPQSAAQIVVELRRWDES